MDGILHAIRSSDMRLTRLVLTSCAVNTAPQRMLARCRGPASDGHWYTKPNLPARGGPRITNFRAPIPEIFTALLT
jgi:hypothetical protein